MMQNPTVIKAPVEAAKMTLRFIFNDRTYEQKTVHVKIDPEKVRIDYEDTNTKLDGIFVDKSMGVVLRKLGLTVEEEYEIRDHMKVHGPIGCLPKNLTHWTADE